MTTPEIPDEDDDMLDEDYFTNGGTVCPFCWSSVGENAVCTGCYFDFDS